MLRDRLQTLREATAASRACDESVMRTLRSMLAEILAVQYRRRAKRNVSEAEAFHWATRVVEASPFTYAVASAFLEQYLNHRVDDFWQEVDFPS